MLIPGRRKMDGSLCNVMSFAAGPGAHRFEKNNTDWAVIAALQKSGKRGKGYRSRAFLAKNSKLLSTDLQRPLSVIVFQHMALIDHLCHFQQ